MLDYRKFKQDFFKNKIKARKKELGYLTNAKNKTGNECDKCIYIESLSPYLHRCCLISFDINNGRTASINMGGCCNKFIGYSYHGGSKDIELMEKYNNIEYDELDKREIINAHREASKKL